MTLKNHLTHKTLYVSLCALGITSSQLSMAQTTKDEPVVELPAIHVHLDKGGRQGVPLAGISGTSEQVIANHQLKQRATNLGDALATELGVHASQFGGGASAPVIRG